MRQEGIFLRESYFKHYSYVAIILFNTGLCRSVFLQFLFKSSHRKCSARKGALRNFAKPTGKNLRLSVLLNKVANLRPATLLKMRLRLKRSPVNPVKPPRTASSQNTFGATASVFWKTSFSSFCAFWLFCFESNVLSQGIKYVLSCYVILLCNFVM